MEKETVKIIKILEDTDLFRTFLCQREDGSVFEYTIDADKKVERVISND